MRNTPMNINDNEIHIISPAGLQHPRNNKKRRIVFFISFIFIVAVIAAVIMYIASVKPQTNERWILAENIQPSVVDLHPTDSMIIDNGYVEVDEIAVNGKRLTFLIPQNAIPVLTIGEESQSDTTSVLMAQAADIRADNGMIAGTFILNGDLVSKGEAKAGFCAIVNDHISIGVADATPLLEQAIESNGYFFRQYPLVVGGQLVENKIKNRSSRKALVDIDGNVGIAISWEKLTLHEFSELLIDAGVRNAIYIVGGSAPVHYRDISGKRHKLGKDEPVIPQYTSYIVWK